MIPPHHGILPSMGLPASIARRISRPTDTGCWLWLGRLDADGYGRLDLPGKRGSLAHRVVYELLRGQIPPGLLLLHQCDELHPGTMGRRCVNPSHLTPGTTRENAEDRHRKGRSPRQARKSPGCPAGRRYW